MIYIVNTLLAILLLLCCFDMPYDYYMVIRFATMSICGYKAYVYFDRKKVLWGYFFLLVALLFQPILKIALHKPTWNFIDVALSIILIVELYKFYTYKNEK